MLLLDADKPGEEIKFFINSPGGVVTSGMVIYDTMKMMKSLKHLSYEKNDSLLNQIMIRQGKMVLN